MKILLATPFLSQHADAGLFWAKAISTLGHDLRLWDFRHEPEPPAGQWDLGIVMKGENINPSNLRYRRWCYWPDAIARTPGLRGILETYAYGRIFSCEIPLPAGWEFFPSGFDPCVHKNICPEDIKARPKDSLYIGTNNSKRKAEWLDIVKPQYIIGNGWISATGEKSVPAYLENFTDAANYFKVLIDIHAGPTCVNRKFFEMIACGFTIVDYRPEVELILGKELTEKVSFHTPQEGKAMLDRWLNSSPLERHAVWVEEREAIEPYSYVNVLRRMLE